MVNIVKCIAGFTFLVYANSTSAEIVAACDVEVDGNGGRRANCSDKGIDRIPRNLGANVKILDVSNNNPKFTLYSDDLNNYSNLHSLIMRNLTNVTAFPPGFFKPTAQLEMLNISHTKISSLKELPATIKALNFSHCETDSMDLSHLNHLEELILRNCRYLQIFPSIPKLAPLQVVDVRQCPLIRTNYSYLAPFCQLRYFGLKSKALKRPEYTTECCGLYEWGRMWNIRGTKYQTCFRNRTHRRCSDFVTINNAAIQEYRECYARLGLRRFIIVMAVLIISLTLLTTLIAVALYFHRKSRSKRKREANMIEPSTTPTEILNQELVNIEAEGDIES